MINAFIKKLAIVGVALFMCQSMVFAEETIKPFLLASSGLYEFNDKISETKERLSAAGFEIVGEYLPYADTHIIIFTSDELKTAATKTERGGYGAVMRASITRVDNQIEVAYTNPIYWANAYRMASDLDEVNTKLKSALGVDKAFGTGKKQLSKKDMRKYHYTFLMEYFDDPSELASFGNHEEAVKTIEAKLAAGVGASSKIYRIDLGKDTKGKQMTLFGIALKGKDKDDCSGDNYIMSRIDKSQPRHSAHLPYELLVYGSQAEALYARFRIALSWPHLPMMASKTGATFMSIMCAPGAIEDVLKLVAGYKEKVVKEEEEY